jgi:hypothetical protein
LESIPYHWLKKDKRRETLLLSFIQPATAKQLSNRTEIKFSICNSFMKKLSAFGLSICRNSDSQRGKLYDLTDAGEVVLKQIANERGITVRYWIDWKLFACLAFNQRSDVLLTWRNPNESLRAIEIKERAQKQKPSTKMSANNVRDVLRYLTENALVIKILKPRSTFPRFEITELGWIYRIMLNRIKIKAS